MTKLIPMRRCDREEKPRPAAWTELTQLSDWTLKDIGIHTAAAHSGLRKAVLMV